MNLYLKSIHRVDLNVGKVPAIKPLKQIYYDDWLGQLWFHKTPLHGNRKSWPQNAQRYKLDDRVQSCLDLGNDVMGKR